MSPENESIEGHVFGAASNVLLWVFAVPEHVVGAAIWATYSVLQNTSGDDIEPNPNGLLANSATLTGWSSRINRP